LNNEHPPQLRRLGNNTPPRQTSQQLNPNFRIVSPNTALQRSVRMSPRRLRPPQARRRPRNRHLDSSPEVPERQCQQCHVNKPVNEFGLSQNDLHICNECNQARVNLIYRE
jgi:hypothetical protein